VTEQVVSAISAQSWIDGKILGLSAVAAASTTGYVASGLIIVAARASRFQRTAAEVLIDPWRVALMAALALLASRSEHLHGGDRRAHQRPERVEPRRLPDDAGAPVMLAALRHRPARCAAMRLLSMFPPPRLP